VRIAGGLSECLDVSGHGQLPSCKALLLMEVAGPLVGLDDC
jgi:hypothetical protein